MRDPRIAQAREDVEATERRWGAVGSHRRDPTAGRYKTRLAACDVHAPLLRPSPPLQRPDDLFGWQRYDQRPAMERQALVDEAVRITLEGGGSWVGDFAPRNFLGSRTDAKSNGVVTAGSIERHTVGALTLINGAPGTGKTIVVAAIVKDLARSQESGHHIRLALVNPPDPTAGPVEPRRHCAARRSLEPATAPTDVTSIEVPNMWAAIERFVAEASVEVQVSLFELARRWRLVEMTAFHVLRQRDGEMPVLPLPEDEPGVDSQIVVTAPISANAPNGWAGGSLEMDGYLAA